MTGIGQNPFRLALRIVIALVAFVYFFIDAVFALLVRPLGRWVSKTALYQLIARWVVSLGPYPTLILFLVPVAMLEPAKPIGFYFMGTGRLVTGAGIIILAEILKVLIVERLFHLSRPKLMLIPAFARGYCFVMQIVAHLRASRFWQSVEQHFRNAKALLDRVMEQFKRALRGRS